MTLQRTVVAAFAALALAACLALPARAEQPAKGKPAADNEARVHRMEVWNGAVRTVHYFTQGYSPGEEAALRDLARTENDLATAEDILTLRRLYLRNERILEQRRGQVNPLLYGYSSEYAAGLFPGVVTGQFGYGGFAGYPYGLGGFGNVVGTFGYPGASASLGTAANSLAFGVGSEGVIKDVLARTLTDPSASEAYTRAARAYDTAVARVGDLKVGSKIGVVKGERVIGPRVTLVMKKDNEKIAGNLVNDSGDWITVETDKEEITVRRADVDRIVRVKSDVKP